MVETIRSFVGMGDLGLMIVGVLFTLAMQFKTWGMFKVAKWILTPREEIDYAEEYRVKHAEALGKYRKSAPTPVRKIIDHLHGVWQIALAYDERLFADGYAASDAPLVFHTTTKGDCHTVMYKGYNAANHLTKEELATVKELGRLVWLATRERVAQAARDEENAVFRCTQEPLFGAAGNLDLHVD